MISLYMQWNGIYNDNNTYISSNSHIPAQLLYPLINDKVISSWIIHLPLDSWQQFSPKQTQRQHFVSLYQKAQEEDKL